MNPLLEMRGISRRFGAVIALQNVDLTVRPGTVHALIGENGAGKSTLMNILCGALLPDSGAMRLDGRPYAPRNPKEARAAGIGMIHQELTLAPHLTVEENITLGAERHRFGILQHLREDVRKALSQLGHGELELDAPVMTLSVGKQQIVEIARCLLLRSKLIVMDEPTSSLSAEDTQNLFKVIKRLRNRGITVIYISHFLEEIQEIADEYTVLRDGRTVAAGIMEETTIPQIVSYMIGRTQEEMFPRLPHSIGKELLAARGVSRMPRVRNVDLTLHEGEILGIAGLIGSGRTELLRCLFGLDKASGTLTLDGRTIDLGKHSPQKALALGISLLSENRKEEGLALQRPIRDNITYSALPRFTGFAGRIDERRETAAAVECAQQVNLRFNHLLDPVSSLSGGNQQKA
ncbi:MAG: sugar ABC transporter ATP-binding protein, partial [candidate division KSB1 bacterium]|nr:sugar ABC transporter ATP-binding protein [candidate division KSB1 bacterium]